MNEGDFTNNFTWFEWSFVSPEQLSGDEAAMSAEESCRAFTSEQRYDVWGDDKRWTT